MQNLKKWVLIPLAAIVGIFALLVLLIIASAKVGFLWGLLITSVAALVAALLVATRVSAANKQNVIGGSVLALLSIWGIVGIANVGAWMIQPGLSSPAQAAAERSDAEVYAMAETIISKYLKAPATAKFPSSSEVQIQRFEDNGFRVDGYVDSQNSFGAMLRSPFTVIFQYKKQSDEADVFAVVLDGETLLKKVPDNK